MVECPEKQGNEVRFMSRLECRLTKRHMIFVFGVILLFTLSGTVEARNYYVDSELNRVFTVDVEEEKVNWVIPILGEESELIIAQEFQSALSFDAISMPVLKDYILISETSSGLVIDLSTPAELQNPVLLIEILSVDVYDNLHIPMIDMEEKKPLPNDKLYESKNNNGNKCGWNVIMMKNYNYPKDTEGYVLPILSHPDKDGWVIPLDHIPRGMTGRDVQSTWDLYSESGYLGLDNVVCPVKLKE